MLLAHPSRKYSHIDQNGNRIASEVHGCVQTTLGVLRVVSHHFGCGRRSPLLLVLCDSELG